jgi:hypothetical protein
MVAPIPVDLEDSDLTQVLVTGDRREGKIDSPNAARLGLFV